MAEKTELEKTAVAGMQLERPDFVEVGNTEGLVFDDRNDVQVPRLGIAQGLSPELNPNKPQYIEGLKLGDMFNNLTKEIYGRTPLTFCIVAKYPARFIEFNPLDAGGGIRDMNVPAGDPRTLFTKDPATGKSINPVATKFMDYVALLLPRNKLIALSFKSTGLKVARRLNGLMQDRLTPLYTGVYTIRPAEMTNPKGTFYIPVIDNAGWHPTKASQDFAQKMYNNLLGKEVKFDRAGQEEEGDTSFNTEEM